MKSRKFLTIFFTAIAIIMTTSPIVSSISLPHTNMAYIEEPSPMNKR